MTDAEANEILKDANVSFSSYYKYSFAFVGSWLGFKIKCGFGGSSDDIYKSEVTNRPRKFGRVEDWDWVTLTKGEALVYEYDSPRW